MTDELQVDAGQTVDETAAPTVDQHVAVVEAKRLVNDVNALDAPAGGIDDRPIAAAADDGWGDDGLQIPAVHGEGPAGILRGDQSTAPGEHPPSAGAGGGAEAQGKSRRAKGGVMDAETAKRILEEPWDDTLEGDAELPPLHDVLDDGTPCPIPGVISLFLTGTTCELLGIASAGRSVATVTKEALLGDVQFRGAISDFHAFRQQIADADCDPLVVRANHSDLYGDGNNYELAVTAAAADVWARVTAELERRAARDARLELRRQAERVLPRSKRPHKFTPWVSLGSEADVEAINIAPDREPVTVTIERRRRMFNRPCDFSDKDAQEIHSLNASHMELRPFKDPLYELHRRLLDKHVQVLDPVREVAVQATGLPYTNGCSQYEPIDVSGQQKRQLLREPRYKEFLRRVRGDMEQALLQNTVLDIFAPDFTDEEEAFKGNRSGKPVHETMSFMDIAYCKDKMVSALHWHPTQRGVVAVAIANKASFAQRVADFGQSADFAILIWNFKDLIQPEVVLESPFEVMAFSINPVTPTIVAGGCYNGQVVLWDLAAARDSVSTSGAAPGGAEDARAVVLEHKYISTLEASHRQMVADLRWLPGLEVTSKGSLNSGEEMRGTCHFFATCAGDGKVNFWDSRVDAQRKKGRKNEDPMDREWKPAYTVPLLSIAGADLAATVLDFDPKLPGEFFVGSFDGEVTCANFVKPEDEEHPDFTKFARRTHAGPVVTLARSPFFPDILLSVGDWHFQLWRIGTPEPIFVSEYSAEKYTSGVWSPTRPAVLFLGMIDGSVQCWDFLDRSHEPALSANVCSSGITCMAFNTAYATDRAQLLAIGDREGVLRINEVPSTLRRGMPRERELMRGFLELEAAKLADAESRQGERQAALQQLDAVRKDTDDGDARARDLGDAAEGAPGADGLIDQQAEKEYFELEAHFKALIGLTDGPA